MDEAAAAVRVQLDSQPEKIDSLKRRELQLDIEKVALEQEKDDASKQRLKLVKEPKDNCTTSIKMAAASNL